MFTRRAVVAGLLASLAMGMFQMLYEAVAGAGLWSPPTLIAATIIRDLQTAPIPVAFQPLAVVLGLMGHMMNSMILGLLFALLIAPRIGEDVLVSVGGQQADFGRRVAGGHFGSERRPDLRQGPDLERQNFPVGVDVEVLGTFDLVAPDDIPGPRPVVGERLRIPVHDPKVGLQRPADDSLVEGDSVRASVGQSDNGEVAFRHHEQLGEPSNGAWPPIGTRATSICSAFPGPGQKWFGPSWTN